MTDNSTIPVNVGTEVFANHDIGGVKYPRARLTWGPSGVTNDADIASGKPVPIQLRGSDGTDRSNLLPVSQSGTWTVQPGNTANTTAWLVNPGIQLGAGAATGTTTRVTVDTGQLGALGQTTGSASVSVVPANDYGMPFATDKMFAGTTSLTPKFATIAAASSGDNSIVASVSSKKIRVLALKITANGAVNAKWRSATTDITGLSYFAAAGDGEVLPFNPVGWFETAVTSALQVNLSGAVATGGHITYIEV